MRSQRMRCGSCSIPEHAVSSPNRHATSRPGGSLRELARARTQLSNPLKERGVLSRRGLSLSFSSECEEIERHRGRAVLPSSEVL